MNLSITVITPSLNHGKFIERTIQSVIQQNIPNLKYIIVDGGSIDETLSIFQKYESQIAWTSEPDQGQAHAINKAFKKTNSDIIGWLNSDDIYYQGAIARALEFFEKNPEVDVVYGNANHIDLQDKIIQRYPTETWNIKRFVKTCYISQPAVFFRRRVLEKCGFLDEKLNYCMDYEFWLRLALQGVKFSHIPAVLAGSRLYPETKTLRAPLDFSSETMRMLSSKLGYVPGDWLINHAMLSIKSQTALRFPSLKFNLLSMFIAASLSMQWNGAIRGLLMSLLLPTTAVGMMRQKKINLPINS